MLKIIFSIGLCGDLKKIRYYAKRYWIFVPLYKLYTLFHGAYIPLTNDIADSVNYIHAPYGCFFSSTCKIGENCTIQQHVTIGSNFINKKEDGGAPIIGNNVFIGAGAKIIGKIKIGNNVNIGAGCIVVTDIPDNVTVVMNKPRIILKK